MIMAMNVKWVLAMGLVLLVLGCTSAPPATRGNTNTGNGGGDASASTVTITMSGTSFTPNVISVKAGDTLRFVNESGYAHTVHILQNGTDYFPDTSVAGGQTLDVKMTTAGNYDLDCSPHHDAGMTGTITVN